MDDCQAWLMTNSIGAERAVRDLICQLSKGGQSSVPFGGCLDLDGFCARAVKGSMPGNLPPISVLASPHFGPASQKLPAKHN